MKYGVLFGGQSFEHEISIVSAVALKKVLDHCEFIFVSQDRKFYYIAEEKLKSSLFSSGAYKKEPRLFLNEDGFYQKKLFAPAYVEFDVLINLVHGGDGEDGKLAGILEFYSVPFIGPRVEASVLSFNKRITKFLGDAAGVEVLTSDVISKNARDEAHPKAAKIGYPIILKPCRLGSSIGVVSVATPTELDYALDVAFEFDSQVLIEPFVVGVREYNQAGCFTNKLELSIIEEPSKKELLDFKQKYLDFSRVGKAVEAALSDEVALKIRDAFSKIYNLGFEGALIRCDFFVIENEVYLNEVNPIPGSLANYLFEDFVGVLDRLASNLPKQKNINIGYKYINEIQAAKGKL
ncbi:MAG: hypothetical protein RL154_339 [Pseudomonadota bacterium]|jgi:D-alanine-D-alanine ligase